MPLVLTRSFRLSIKEGAKPTMFLLSMVQSAFPDWVHRNVKLSPQTFVAKKERNLSASQLIAVLLQIPQCSQLAALLSPSLREAPHLHALGKRILYFYDLTKSYFGWFFFSACLTLKFEIGSCFPFFSTIKEHNRMCFKMTVHMNVTVRPFLLSNLYN